jgi:hypothetical protein
MKTEITFTYASVNGVDGRIWTQRALVNGAWVHQGRRFLPNGATIDEVVMAFDEVTA